MMDNVKETANEVPKPSQHAHQAGQNDSTQQKSRKKRTKAIQKKIQDQIEFYFSDSNLMKDRFMKQKIDEDKDGYVSLNVIVNFNRMKSLCTNHAVVLQAIKKSSLLELSPDELKVKRKVPLQSISQEEIDSRTIYVENLPNTNHDNLKKFFSRFGPVTYVSIPKYKHTGVMKGFAFIEFASANSVPKAIEFYKNKQSKSDDPPPTEGECLMMGVEDSVFDENKDEGGCDGPRPFKRQRSSDTDEECENKMVAEPGSKRKKLSEEIMKSDDSVPEDNPEVRTDMDTMEADSSTTKTDFSTVIIDSTTINTESKIEAESNIGTNSSTEVHSSAKAHSNTEAHFNTEAHTNTEAHANTEAHFKTEAHANTEDHSNINVESNTDKAYSNIEAHSNTEACSNTGAHPITEADSNTEEVPSTGTKRQREDSEALDGCKVPRLDSTWSEVSTIEDETEETKKKKKTRTRSRRRRESLPNRNLKESNLKVISKSEWLELKDIYKKLQKEHMKSVKEANKKMPSDTQQRKSEYVTNCLLRVTCSGDHKVTKESLKEHCSEYGPVAYIDYEDGADSGYVRYGESGCTGKAVEGNGKLPNVTFEALTEEDEKVYFLKTKSERRRNFNKRRKNTRGHDKVISRAIKRTEKQNSKGQSSSQAVHIRFSDSENEQ